MIREDESSVPLREIARWVIPFGLVLIGLSLFFALGREIRPIAAPIHLESNTP
jgi:hypothetical protein